MASAYRDRHGYLVFRNLAKKRVGNCAVQDGSSHHKARRADKPEHVGKRPRPVEVRLHVGRCHVAGEPINILDASGRIVLNARASAVGMAQLDVSGLANGIYTVRSASGITTRFTKR